MTRDYSIEQAEFLNHVRTKVAALFEASPVPAHNLDHAERVAENIIEIAKGEGYKDLFLAEITALVHDIGRVPHHHDSAKQKTSHHELSYVMLQEWMNQDSAFDILTDEEKKMILYAVRYHWNNGADDYPLAWLLRDADKLDMLGEYGLERSKEYAGYDEEKFQFDIRMKYDSVYWVHTATARKIMKQRKLVETVDAFYLDYLKQKIEPIVL